MNADESILLNLKVGSSHDQMAQALPSSASFSSDCALISRYAAARGHADAAPELNHSGVSSSPNALLSQRVSNEPNLRPVPEMGSSISQIPNDKAKQAAEWQNNSRDTLPVTGNIPNVTETTPLISPRWDDGGVPENDEDDLAWWKELKTLSSYTIPVFGYATMTET